MRVRSTHDADRASHEERPMKILLIIVVIVVIVAVVLPMLRKR